MITVSLAGLLLGFFLLLAVLGISLTLIVHVCYARGWYDCQDKHAPSLAEPPLVLTPEQARERFDQIREALPVDDDELAGARPVHRTARPTRTLRG